MANQTYKNQVKLLLDVLPEVAKEKCFALHGGTAINLFIRDMPRLSVDIDLTYIPLEDRITSIKNINDALLRIKTNIEAAIPRISVEHNPDSAKLQVATREASIKLEVNLTKRGVYKAPTDLPLCQKAQTDFDIFCVVPVVSTGLLYGGKICAALDRQHPRDLFDVKYLLENEGFTDEIKEGFIFYLLGSDRPINELIYPNMKDQRSALDNQFNGMSTEPFTYEDYERTREKLVHVIHENITNEDKLFLLNFKNLTPDWSKYNFADFPSIQWKLQNLQKLKDSNTEKHTALYETLKKKLGK